MRDERAVGITRRAWAASLLGLGAVVFTASCGGGGGGSCTTPTQISGVWSGTTNDEVARGTGTLDVIFTQNGCQLGGTWQTEFPQPGTSDSQDVSGFIDGTAVRFQIQAPTNPCRTRVSGTLVSATEITGTYATRVCGQSDSGTFTITFRAPLPTPVPTATAPPLPAS